MSGLVGKKSERYSHECVYRMLGKLIDCMPVVQNSTSERLPLLTPEHCLQEGWYVSIRRLSWLSRCRKALLYSIIILLEPAFQTLTIMLFFLMLKNKALC